MTATTISEGPASAAKTARRGPRGAASERSASGRFPPRVAALIGDHPPVADDTVDLLSRYHAIVLRRPSSNGTSAFQPNSFFARDTSSARRGCPSGFDG